MTKDEARNLRIDLGKRAKKALLETRTFSEHAEKTLRLYARSPENFCPLPDEIKSKEIRLALGLDKPEEVKMPEKQKKTKWIYYIDGEKVLLNLNYYSGYDDIDSRFCAPEFESSSKKGAWKTLAMEDAITLGICTSDIAAWRLGFDCGDDTNNVFCGVAEKLTRLWASSEPD